MAGDIEKVKGEVIDKAQTGGSILIAPVPSKEPGQRSANISDLYLTRFTPPWSRPSSLPAYTWRAWVMNQPVALVCRETLIANLEALDWKITPRNMKYKEELDPVCRYYEKLIRNGGNYPALGLDYSGLLEWVVGDLLDTPFGGFAELGRKNDDPKGRVLWIKPVDAGTLYPTLNDKWPTVQYYQGYEVVPFPSHAQARIGWSPHQYLFREGWMMAPPEKIYFALDMLNKGDKYYANLMLDIPSAGILDLGDMAADEARLWIDSFRTFLNDTTTSFKIPVLYEHNNKVEFLPFGKVPNDIMFDRITLKYAALVCGAYGMTLGDIGLSTASSSGETLAGSIRQERKTKKTGFARVKTKWKAFIDSFLPDTIELTLIDYDDELNVAMGRARLASSTAMNIWATMGAFSPQEMRSQALNDGLINITIPDTLPEDAKPIPQKPQERPGALGSPVPPSAGGQGEVRQSVVTHRISSPVNLNKIINALLKQVYDKIQPYGDDEMFLAKSMVGNALFSDEDTLEIQGLLEGISKSKAIRFDFKELEKEMRAANKDKADIQFTKSRIESGINAFLAKAAAVTMMEVLTSDLVIDNSDILDYDYIAQEVQRRMTESISDFVNLYVQDTLDEIRKDTEK